MAENKVRFLRGTAAEYANAVKDDDTFYYTTDDAKFYIGSKEITGGGITVDSELSDTSTHPVQNKVIKSAIDDKADKAVATATADGLMSTADKTKLDNADNTYALKSKYGDTTIDVGRKDGSDIGDHSTAEGYYTTASGHSSHAEGSNTIASGKRSHAECDGTTASGNYSHAEGFSTIASGSDAHAEGSCTIASGNYSHASGYYTKALHDNETASGKYNESNEDTLFSIGDGTADDARHNAFEITSTGGKLHDKNIVTDDMSLPANGGNADTVDNKHYTDFSQNAVLTTIDQVNDPNLESGIYSVEGVNMDFSTSISLVFFMLIVNKHRQTPGYGTQIAIPYDNGLERGVFYRTCAGGTWQPWVRLNDGGNADTVDGLHADDFVNATDFGQIQIPNNVDVPAWIFANGKKYQQYMTNSTNVGMTNVPNNASDYVWYWRDGLNILAREWVTGRYYICDTINGGFSGWKDVYTSGFKPYITLEITVYPKDEFILTTGHGFMPTAVFAWNTTSGSAEHPVGVVKSAYIFNSEEIILDEKPNSIPLLYKCIIFR